MLTALYIHIPFCDQICLYCDFHKEMAKPSKKKRYIDALLLELNTYKDQLSNLETIYIGGGSPTSLSYEDLQRLLKEISNIVDVSSVIEYTIESNPNDITPLKTALLKSYGINRVSLGVQTFNNTHLKLLGRSHKEEDISNAMDILHNSGINNISIDLIFSLPGQTMKELRYDIDKAIALNPAHISYYSLIFEEKTKLFYMYEEGLIDMNSEDLEGDMYEAIITSMTNHGYNHYEISNYAKKGFESRHNKVYWNNTPYLGIGSGSHSLYNGKRFFNIPNVSKYITSIHEGINTKQEEVLEPIREAFIMGLRLLKGVNIKDIEKQYQIKVFKEYPALKKLIEYRLLKLEEEYLSFTKKGLLLGNVVFEIF